MGEALNNIIKSCFEGFFGTMIAGLVFYTIQSVRQNRKMLLWLWLLLAGMMAWRFTIPNFYSQRYALIFIFPAVLLTAFMMVKFKRWWWVLIIVLGIISCCKIFRMNESGRLLTDAAEVIRRDAAGKKTTLLIVDKKDVRRMEFYSSLPAVYFNESKNFSENLRDLPRIIDNNARYADAVYLCCDVPQGEKIDGKSLGLDGQWQLIFSTVRNRKRKIEFHVYRYCRNSAVITAVPSGKNLIVNGGFEKSVNLPEKTLQQLKAGKHSYFTGQEQIPDKWSVMVNRPGLNIEIEAAENGIISGDKSLRLKTPSHFCGVISRPFTLDGHAEFFCRIKGDAGAVADLTLCAYTSKQGGQPEEILLLPVKIVVPDKVMEYSFVFDPAEYGVAGKYFRLMLSVQGGGEVFFDDVTVVNKIISEKDKKVCSM